jgi:hypothetical protein
MKSWKDVLSKERFTYEEMVSHPDATGLDKKYNLPLDEMESPGVCYMRVKDILDNPYNKVLYRNKNGDWSQINLDHIDELWEGGSGVVKVGGLQKSITLYVDSCVKKGGHHRRLMWKLKGFNFIAVNFAKYNGEFRLWSKMSESEKIKDLTGDNIHVEYPEQVHVAALAKYSEVLESEGYKVWSPEWTEEMLLQKGSKIGGTGLDLLRVHWMFLEVVCPSEMTEFEGSVTWGGKEKLLKEINVNGGTLGVRFHPDGTPIKRDQDDYKNMLLNGTLDKNFSYMFYFRQMVLDSNRKWAEETKYKQGDFDPKFSSMIGDINYMYPLFGAIKEYLDESLTANYRIPDNGMYNKVEWSKPKRLEERSTCLSYTIEELLMEHMERGNSVFYERETKATQHLDLVLSNKDEFGQDMDVKVTGTKVLTPTFSTNALKLCDNIYVATHPDNPYLVFAATLYTLSNDYSKQSSFAQGSKRKISTKNLYLGINGEIEHNGKMYKRGHVLLGDINTEKKLTGKGSKSRIIVDYFDVRKLDMRIKKLTAEDRRPGKVTASQHSFY